jgi:YD repeat-containing protein
MKRPLIVAMFFCLGFAVPQTSAQFPACDTLKPIIIVLGGHTLPIFVKHDQCDVDAYIDHTLDEDADRLADAWELQWFLDLGIASGIPGALTDYDGDGLKDIEEFRFGLDPTTNDFAMPAHTDTFRYDRIGQLTSLTSYGQTVRFTYDAEGNILSIVANHP